MAQPLTEVVKGALYRVSWTAGITRRLQVQHPVLITNDSDLLEPVRMVRQQLGLPIGILNPHRRPSRVLVQQATFVRQIRPHVLMASQFPNPMTDAQGTFHKPASW
jgi:hypothetical protein